MLQSDRLPSDQISNQVSDSELMDAFQNVHYQRHNQRRLDHLASLNLPISQRTVLEVGAGIGDHTHFFLEQSCQVVSIEARSESLTVLQARFPEVQGVLMDVDHLAAPLPDRATLLDRSFDIVYCYGLLYHLAHPAEALQWMANRCHDLLLLETCVHMGEEEALNPCDEDVANPTQSASGQGCRPTRRWVYNQLKQWMEFVYLPKTQPDHEEFPLDWRQPTQPNHLTRAIFIGSRRPLNHANLVDDLPMEQTPCQLVLPSRNA